MNIGHISGLTGVSSKTIRYYESNGLIAEPPRTPSGYRDYGDSDVDVLRFVGQARLLGFPLNDVTQLLSLWQDRDRSSAEGKSLTERDIAEIGQRIAELAAVRRTLLDLSRRCRGDNRPECPILDDLAG